MARVADYVTVRMLVLDPVGPAIAMKHGQDDVDALKNPTQWDARADRRPRTSRALTTL